MTEFLSDASRGKEGVTEHEQLLTSTYSNSAVSFLLNDKEYSNNNNDHHHKNPIQALDLPYGLIDLLVDNNFTLESLINTDPSELSYVLAIDQEVVGIICTAAKNKMNKTTKR
jgi:hypothetical protein